MIRNNPAYVWNEQVSGPSSWFSKMTKQQETDDLIARLGEQERKHGEGCPCKRCQDALFAANDAYMAEWLRSRTMTDSGETR